MAQVGIVMGSDSDMPVMAKAADILEELGISYEMAIISAHREPDVFFEYAKNAEEKGFKVIIAGAGKAAHLPGMCAAIFPMPVIGVPMKTSDLGGVDSRRGAFEAVERLFAQAAGERAEEGCQTAGSGIQELSGRLRLIHGVRCFSCSGTYTLRCGYGAGDGRDRRRKRQAEDGGEYGL